MTGNSDTTINAAIEAAFDKIGLDIAERLRTAARTVVAEHRRRLGVRNPAPHLASAGPGDYPRLRSGRLQDSFRLDTESLAAIAAAGGVGIVAPSGAAAYGRFLVGRGYLALSDTVADLRDRIAAIMQGEGTRA